MGLALPIRENVFGKMRGRFDESSARSIQRQITTNVFRQFMSLPDDERLRLQKMLDDVFEGSAKGGWQLVKRERG